MKKIASILIILAAFLLFSSKAYAGAFDLTLSNGNTTLNCQRGDTNCTFQTVVIAKNRTDKPLYNTTIYTSSPNNSMTYIGFDGSWTSGQSKASRVVQPGEEIVNTLVKVVYPSNFTGPLYAAFYIDAQTCNPNTTPPDCTYYGASSFTVTINIVDPTPTATPRPTSSPTSTPRVTPTPSRTTAPTPSIRVTSTPASGNGNQNQNQNGNSNQNSKNNANRKEDSRITIGIKDIKSKILKKKINVTPTIEITKPASDSAKKATGSARMKNKQVKSNNKNFLRRILSFFHFK